MAEKIFTKPLKFILTETLFDVLTFPLWWYANGLRRVLNFLHREMTDWADRLSLRILFANLLKPMYGDYSRTGRIISFFLRIIVFFVKLIVFIIWAVILLALFFIYILIPPFIFYEIILTASGQRGFNFF